MQTESTTRYISTTDTAKLLRKALKAEWPGVKFSVRSNKYSGGSSIEIGWTDGPTAGAVDRIGKLFAGSTFDGMQDLKVPHSSVLSTDGGAELVHFSADFVFTRRDISPEWQAELETEIAAETGRPFVADESLPFSVLSPLGAETSGCPVGSLWPEDKGQEEPGCRLVWMMAVNRVRS